jgi:predicted alpha/beta hydrolase family esterase
MNQLQQSTVLIVPGLRDHMPDHWQTHLERELDRVACVPRMRAEKDKLSCAAWVSMLDRSLANIAGPVILVAHSGGVMMVAHWATRHRRPIQGALLATPPDFDSPLPKGYPSQDVLREGGWMPAPRTKLPFPSIVAASENDPLCCMDRAEALARDWGSAVVNIGAAGHLNPSSGFGPWPRAHEFIAALSSPHP